MSSIVLGLRKATLQQEGFGVWSGGLKVSANAGEQYVSGRDDAVDAMYMLPRENFGDSWFLQLQQETASLDNLAKKLYGCVMNYFKLFKVEGQDIAAAATLKFWHACETHAQRLINDCDKPSDMQALRHIYARQIEEIFNYTCPSTTATNWRLG